ncbi:hypothetical protein AK812_SmicGene11339 [Symbiodinium microadriaticum]|uniref:Uncharacterized protein n=1 Tax=Symbiodinium microadriaticum TaxID=2951 RepID=A0A1Q9EDH3_SYMMI|nr:hypothetical protein AK812_SmicGene11339 [Symbiodinium microadriaticum]
MPLSPNAGQRLRFRLGLINGDPPEEGVPVWSFEVRASASAGAAVIERTSDYPGYGVYLKLEVAGLYGSVREVGYKYNYVRLTFRLPPAATMATGGTLIVFAPSVFLLDATTFNRENLPPQSAATADMDSEDITLSSAWRMLNVTLIYPLVVGRFYSFSFSVTNPATTDGTTGLVCELWCYELGGRVVAANTEVPQFALEAFFQLAEVSPSSVLPTQSPNEVEVQFVLGSTQLSANTGSLVVQLPEGFAIQEDSAGTSPWCLLDTGNFFSPGEDDSGFSVKPLPASSRCTWQSSFVTVELQEALDVDIAYRFLLRLSNSLDIGVENRWRVSTELAGDTLHLAESVPNFVLTPMPDIGLYSTDVREGFVQLVLIQFRLTTHVLGLANIQVRGPLEFALSCSEKGIPAPRGLLPADSECFLIGPTLQMTLPDPLPYAPYQLQLQAGEVYIFGLFCANPEQYRDSGTFQVRIRGTVATASERLLDIQPYLLAPKLAAPLDFLEVVTDQVSPAGSLTTVEAPPGFVLATGIGGPCMGFSSSVLQTGDTVLPPSACSGASPQSVLLTMPEALPLLGADRVGLTYVFQLGMISPLQEEMQGPIFRSSWFHSPWTTFLSPSPPCSSHPGDCLGGEDASGCSSSLRLHEGRLYRRQGNLLQQLQQPWDRAPP